MSEMRKVIVTGGTGYIGSHTVVELQRAGYEVVVLDNLSNSERSVLEGITAITGVQPAFLQIDICDRQALTDVLLMHQDAVGVIHFAAFKAVGESVEDPLAYYANNVGGMISLLQVMSVLNMDNLIFSSSCTVYGQPEVLPVTEDAPIQPAQSPYGNTKQICEEMLQDAAAAGLFHRVISLRYFNPVGADPSGLIGELPIGIPANLMPYITQTAAGLRDELKVFGGDYATLDGTAVRDYIHVSDLAAAHRIALERLIEKRHATAFETFNIGTGKGSTVLEVIHAFEQMTGVSLNYRIVDRRPGDVEQVWADTSRANQVLGWTAQRTLEDMAASAWKWEKRRVESKE
ncbi:MAG: UDP-glucose 4-epimerase GalE [Saprospiraceae bacterium]|nr:UDP-glucose 4-epimerase GalE [Saprospiraceae bacterium]